MTRSARRRQRRAAAILLAALCGPLVAPLACGARSDLPVGSDGASADAGADASSDSPIDAPEDAEPDVIVRDCDPEAEVTYIYLVTEEHQILSYDPAANVFELRGTLDCPVSGPTPYSMAVDRKGAAWVLYESGRLYRVRVADASCEETDFVPEQRDFGVFGMGFATELTRVEETLYVAEINPNGPSEGLGVIDLETLELTKIGPFSQSFGRKVELTGTGDGRLYGYFLDEPGPGGRLMEIDKTSGAILSSVELDVGPPQSSLAFAFWGGDFYIFTTQADASGTDVTRYRPSDGTLVVVTTLRGNVVGAGVSTCAPQ